MGMKMRGGERGGREGRKRENKGGKEKEIGKNRQSDKRGNS